MRPNVKLLVASFLLISSFSIAGNGERAFRKLIQSKIMYPLGLSHKVDAEVYVEFTVLENAEIRIDTISCDNVEVRESIAEQLQNLKFDPNNTEIINKRFAYKFKLEVEKPL